MPVRLSPEGTSCGWPSVARRAREPQERFFRQAVKGASFPGAFFRGKQEHAARILEGYAWLLCFICLKSLKKLLQRRSGRAVLRQTDDAGRAGRPRLPSVHCFGGVAERVRRSADARVIFSLFCGSDTERTKAHETRLSAVFSCPCGMGKRLFSFWHGRCIIQCESEASKPCQEPSG